MNFKSHLKSIRLSRTDWVILSLILALGTVVRLYYTTYTRVVWGDEPFYLWLGKSLFSGSGFNVFGYSGAHRPLLLPFITGALGPFVGGSFNASNLVYVLCGTLLAVPLIALARAIYTPTIGWIIGLISATYPALTTGMLTWGTMTEPLFFLWVAIGTYSLFLTFDSRALRWRDSVVLGSMLGLAYITRTEGLILVFASVAMLLIVRLLRKDKLKTLLYHLSVIILIYLLISLPYLIYIRNTTGRWSFLGAAGMAFVSMQGLSENNNAVFDKATWELDPVSQEVYLFAPESETEPLADAFLADPIGLLKRIRVGIRNAVEVVFNLKMIPWFLSVFAFVGLFAHPWNKRRFFGELALITSLSAPVAHIPFFAVERYLAGVLLPAIVWIGVGIWVVGQWLAGTWINMCTQGISSRVQKFLSFVPTLILVVLLLFLGPQVWRVMQSTHSFQPGHLAAAAELQTLGARPEDVVMSRYPAIAFHAGTRWAATPAEDWPTVVEYARRRHARYLAIDGWEASLRPQLDFLMNPALTPPELRYLTTIDSQDPVVLYEFK